MIGILNDWAIIAATRGKRAAPTTIIESSIIDQKFQAIVTLFFYDRIEYIPEAMQNIE